MKKTREESKSVCTSIHKRRRRKRKGLDNKLTQKKGVRYSSEAFVGDDPGPRKR